MCVFVWCVLLFLWNRESFLCESYCSVMERSLMIGSAFAAALAVIWSAVCVRVHKTPSKPFTENVLSAGCAVTPTFSTHTHSFPGPYKWSQLLPSFHLYPHMQRCEASGIFGCTEPKKVMLHMMKDIGTWKQMHHDAWNLTKKKKIS